MESIRLRKLSTLAMLFDSAPQEYLSTASIEMPFSWLDPGSTPSDRPANISAHIRTVRDGSFIGGFLLQSMLLLCFPSINAASSVFGRPVHRELLLLFSA